MSDLVVTVPKHFWPEWIEEGDAAGEAPTGTEWGFYVYGRPPIQPGERLYIVAHNRLRGYAPVTRVAHAGGNRFAICRGAGAMAVTIPERIRGFQGFRARWWKRDDEIPFPDWMRADVPTDLHPDLGPDRRRLT